MKNNFYQIFGLFMIALFLISNLICVKLYKQLMFDNMIKHELLIKQSHYLNEAERMVNSKDIYSINN